MTITPRQRALYSSEASRRAFDDADGATPTEHVREMRARHTREAAELVQRQHIERHDMEKRHTAEFEAGTRRWRRHGRSGNPGGQA